MLSLNAHRKKVGLALGGGVARGLAHIGALRVLRDAGVPIDFIAGTSMGALVGGFYAATGDLNALEEMFHRVRPRDILPIGKLFGKSESGLLFRDAALTEELETALKNVKIEDCRIPFEAVATNMKTGEPVVIKKGNLAEAIRASSALPILLKPVTIDHESLIDGGFSNPVPADVVRRMGADYVIAVDVSSRWLDIENEPLTLANFQSAISNVLSAAEYQLARPIVATADVVLRPAVFNYGRLDFHRVHDIAPTGAAAAEEALRKIRHDLNLAQPEETPLEKFIDFFRGER